LLHLCFLCAGASSRTPTAVAVMRHLVAHAGLCARIEVDGAATAAYHVGRPPDHRTRAAGQARGIDVGGKARQFGPQDWERFDYVLVMDQSNYDDLLAVAPDGASRKLHLLRSFDPRAARGSAVPDPYYGGPEGFEEVLDLCETACSHLLEHLKREHDLR